MNVFGFGAGFGPVTETLETGGSLGWGGQRESRVASGDPVAGSSEQRGKEAAPAVGAFAGLLSAAMVEPAVPVRRPNPGLFLGIGTLGATDESGAEADSMEGGDPEISNAAGEARPVDESRQAPARGAVDAAGDPEPMARSTAAGPDPSRGELAHQDGPANPDGLANQGGPGHPDGLAHPDGPAHQDGPGSLAAGSEPENQRERPVATDRGTDRSVSSSNALQPSYADTEPVSEPSHSPVRGDETRLEEPTTRPAVPGVPPDADRDLGRVDPALREAVGRILYRMENEFGIDADVVEGFRTPARQEALFAQGRSAPGSRVTWTLNSPHSAGKAVDVVLNGQWADLEPYRILQKVAVEEGLATLGMKDPGHLELPRSPGGDGQVPSIVRTPESMTPPPPAPRSTMAPVASVAAVAGQAGVARVAAAASPGRTVRAGAVESSERTAEGAEATSPSNTESPRSGTRNPLGAETAGGVDRELQTSTNPPDPDPARPRPTNDRSSSEIGGIGERKPSRPPVEVDVEPPAVEIPDDLGFQPMKRVEGTDRAPTPDVEGGPEGSGSSAMSGDPSQNVQRVETVVPLREPGVAARVEQVRALQDAADAAGPRMHVDLEDADGAGTRVRVDLRGGRVDARIQVSDPALEARLQERVGELRTSLETKGLEPDSIRVKGPDEAAALRPGSKTVEGAATSGESAARDTARERDRDAPQNERDRWERPADKRQEDRQREDRSRK